MKEKVFVQLHKKIPCLCNKLPYLEFSEDNEIVFYQDHGWWKGVPDKTKFFIDKLSSAGVWLVADGYGVLKDNKLGLSGTYGSGKIAIDFKYLTKDIEDFCRKHCEDEKDMKWI